MWRGRVGLASRSPSRAAGPGAESGKARSLLPEARLPREAPSPAPRQARRQSLAAAGRCASAIFSHLWLCRAVRVSPPGHSLYLRPQPCFSLPIACEGGASPRAGVPGRAPGGGDRPERGGTFVPRLRGQPQSETFRLGLPAAASEARPGIQIRTNFNSREIIIRCFRDSRK